LNSVIGVLSSDSAGKLEEVQNAVEAWDGEQKIVTKHADIEQLDNDVRVPSSGWQCSECNLTENLWLNLTDGHIFCGRRNFDGTGGNNHAVEHYQKTKYPLAVKLGTITPQGADVFSYAEDDMVENPNLKKHLAHFGIDIDRMQKTEKTMIELEIDLNQRLGEWLTIQESNSNLVPLFGAGYTGLDNLGNSCYLNSVVQVLFSISDFTDHYYPPEAIYRSVSSVPDDFNFQMAKLAHGLCSGDYSIEPTGKEAKEQKGIRPRTFKQLVGRGHPEFSTKRQQDAQEFFLHLVNLLERNSVLSGHSSNPADCFKFQIEDRLQCEASKKVNYRSRTEYLLSLPVPMESASNLIEVKKYEIAKKAAEEANEKAPEVVRAQIKLTDCIKAFSQTETIRDFFSPVTKSKTEASKSLTVKTFPDYLVVQMKKFLLDEHWQPKKLDCSIEVPDILDLASLRSKGAQEDEQLFESGDTTAATTAAANKIEFDMSVIGQLQEMGFSENACKRAILAVKSNNIEQAITWLFEHNEDSDFNAPLPNQGGSGRSSTAVDSEAIETLKCMGISEVHAKKALSETSNNVERAIEWYFSHQDELVCLTDDQLQVDAPTGDRVAEYRDGNETYRLFAFISHMGSSTFCGHYVCHIKKDDKWVIYNDNKVAISENPPKELAYMYIFKRI
jgi:ubiquitin carboxyl-terminal hydrolase 5/13